MILIEKKKIATPSARYRARLAQNADDVRRAQRLRFEVFNLELGEGLAASHALERDVDAFDEVCDHLLVEEIGTGEVVGTYRLQIGTVAAAKIGYYSAREFDFAAYEPMRSEMIELGRACVHQAHRSLSVLHLLWRGIAKYAVERKARFLIGCSSLTSQNPLEGAAVYQVLQRKFLVKPAWQTFPQPIFAFPVSLPPGSPIPAPVPKLFRAYLTIGAKICGPPAIDREFGTIDFLTLLDLQTLPMIVRTQFLR
jgi:putative hemolysin